MRVGPAEQRGGAVALRAEALFGLVFLFLFVSSVSSRAAGTKRKRENAGDTMWYKALAFDNHWKTPVYK